MDKSELGKFRILCIGDLHFKENNLAETKELCKVILDTLDKYSPDLVVIMGDTLDKHGKIDVVCQVDAIYFFKDISTKCSVYVLIGNHDLRHNMEYLSKYHPFAGLDDNPKIVVVDKPKLFALPWEDNILLVPFIPVGRFKEATKSYLEENNCCAIMCHQEFRGAKYNSSVSTEGDVWTLNDPFVISGHIHEHDRLQDNIIYVGTPRQLDFGDQSEKSISLFTFDSSNKYPTEERIYLGFKKYVTTQMTVGEAYKWSPQPHTNNRIFITGNIGEMHAFEISPYCAKLLEKGVKIERVITKNRATPIIISSRGNYIKMLRDRINLNKVQMSLLEEICANDE